MSNPYFDPNYNPYTGSVLIGTAIFFIVLSIVSVALRFYARLMSRSQLGIDDWFTVPSMLLCIALSIIQIIAATAGGLGGHLTLVDGKVAHTEQLYAYEKTRYTYEVLGTVGLTAIKLSVLLFFRRLFSTAKTFRIVNNVFIGITVAWGIAYTFSIAFQCTPASTIWEKLESDYGDDCVEIFPLYHSFAFSDLVLDVIIFVLPMPCVWQLKMPLRRKFAVAGVFFLGAIVVAIGITRTIVYHWVITFAMAEPNIWFSDVTWYTSGVLFWHLAENAVGLLGCCLPSYAPFFKGALKGRQSNTAYANTWKRAYPTRVDKGVEDEISLTHAADHKASFPGSEDHTLDSIPSHRILVNREFHVDTSSSRDLSYP